MSDLNGKPEDRFSLHFVELVSKLVSLGETYLYKLFFNRSGSSRKIAIEIIVRIGDNISP